MLSTPDDYTAFHERGAFWLEPIPFLIEVQGPDAAAYLQTQITQDVSALQIMHFSPSALVDRQAYIQSLFLLMRLDESRWALLPEAQGDQLLQHLEKFHFTEDLEIATQDHWEQFRIEGPLCPELIHTLFDIEFESLVAKQILKINVNGGPGWLLLDPMSHYAGVRILASKNQASAFSKVLQEQLKWPLLSPETYEMIRIEAGHKLFGRDFNGETRLTETGMEAQRVSYDKGCYLGQEVIARVKAYGVAPKTMIGLSSSVVLTDPELVIEKKSRGRLLSQSWSPALQQNLSLVLLHKAYRNSDSEIMLDNGQRAVVKRLPFLKAKSAEQQAQELYEKALDIFANGDEAQAIPLLKTAIQKQKSFADAYETLGVILSRQGLHQEAIEVMTALTQIAPEEAMAHTNLSRFHMLLGDKETAEFHMAEATRLNMLKRSKAQSIAQQAAAEIARKKEMMGMFKEVLEEVDENDLVANFGLGKAHVDLQEYEAAVPYLKKAIEVETFYSAAYLHLGKAYEALEQREQAREVYKKGIDAASEKGDLMPLQEMEQRLAAL